MSILSHAAPDLIRGLCSTDVAPDQVRGGVGFEQA